MKDCAPLNEIDYHEKRRMSDWRVSCILPHLETPQLLMYCIPLLQLQSEPPFIILVDTGSKTETIEIINNNFVSDGLSLNMIRANSYLYRSMPVAVALDLGMQLCQTEYAFFTHTDVFLRKHTLIEEMANMCDSDTPVVGYEISPRDPVTPDWMGMVGHTCLMVHMPTIRRLGITWDMQRCMMRSDMKRRNDLRAWPDTETGFNLLLREAGITPKIIGREWNIQRNLDDKIDHIRSYTGCLMANALSDVQQSIFQQASEAARMRIIEWEGLRYKWNK